MPAARIVRNDADDDPKAPVLIVLGMDRLGEFLGSRTRPALVAAAGSRVRSDFRFSFRIPLSDRVIR